VTYVHVPDGAALPTQSSDIAPKVADLTPALKKAIKAESPHVRLINARVVERIRARYSVDDELGMLRLAQGAGGATDPEVAAYGAHVEACRAWGRQERAELGL